MPLATEAYTDPRWFDVERHAVFTRTWQWVCHVEKVRDPGSFTTATVADHPVLIVRDASGMLRSFSNVCRHRAHHLLKG